MLASHSCQAFCVRLPFLKPGQPQITEQRTQRHVATRPPTAAFATLGSRTDSSSGFGYPAGKRPFATYSGSGNPGCWCSTARLCRCVAQVSKRAQLQLPCHQQREARDAPWTVYAGRASARSAAAPGALASQGQHRATRAAGCCVVARTFGHSAHFHGGPVASGFSSLSLASSLSEMSSTRAAHAAGSGHLEQRFGTTQAHRADRERGPPAPPAHSPKLRLNTARTGERARGNLRGTNTHPGPPPSRRRRCWSCLPPRRVARENHGACTCRVRQALEGGCFTCGG